MPHIAAFCGIWDIKIKKRKKKITKILKIACDENHYYRERLHSALSALNNVSDK